jgi:hypothetical protein
MAELGKFERLMLAKVSDAHVAYIARMSNQVYVLKRLEELRLIRSVRDPLFGYTWHITQAGRDALKEGEGDV